MHAFLKHTLALTLCAACSAGTDDESSASLKIADSAALSLAGGPTEGTDPLPLTEEELDRLLDALEQEMAKPR